MVKVCQVKPANGGFGEFDLGEPAEVQAVDTAEEYVTYCLNEVDTLSVDDETAAAAEDAHGRIHDQGPGKVVAFRDFDGYIQLECVYESDDE